MKFSIENGFFIPGPSLAAAKQASGLKFSIENENFKPRMKFSSENENFARGGMVFSCVRARMIFFDLRALWESQNWGIQSRFGTRITPKSDKFREIRTENSISGSESVPKLPTIVEESEEEFQSQAGPLAEKSGALVDDEREPQNQNFVRLSGPME